MANQITDETIEYVGILAKLELSDAEKEEAKKDMETERQTTIERKKKPMKKKNNKMITFAPNKTPIQPYEDNCNHRTDRN